MTNSSFILSRSLKLASVQNKFYFVNLGGLEAEACYQCKCPDPLLTLCLRLSSYVKIYILTVYEQNSSFNQHAHENQQISSTENSTIKEPENSNSLSCVIYWVYVFVFHVENTKGYENLKNNFAQK